MKVRIGMDNVRPDTHAIDVHSKEEKFEPFTVIVLFVRVLYLQLSNPIVYIRFLPFDIHIIN